MALISPKLTRRERLEHVLAELGGLPDAVLLSYLPVLHRVVVGVGPGDEGAYVADLVLGGGDDLSEVVAGLADELADVQRRLGAVVALVGQLPLLLFAPLPEVLHRHWGGLQAQGPHEPFALLLGVHIGRCLAVA